jgi:hypothetical protein
MEGAKGVLSIKDLEINSTTRKGTVLDLKLKSDSNACYAYLFKGWQSGEVGGGQIGTRGKICALVGCSIASSHKVKAPLVANTYYLRTRDGGNLVYYEPSFTAAKLEGNPIWDQFKSELLIPASWLQVKHMLENQVPLTESEVEQLEEVMGITTMAVYGSG